MASRELKTGKMKLLMKKVEIEQVIIAYDALTVIVNPANSVSKLREQLEQIFTEQSKKEVGGADEKSCLFKRIFIWDL
jgi:phosphate transport system substrate-binding protein